MGRLYMETKNNVDKKKVDELVANGEKFIYPQMQDDWRGFVEERAEDGKLQEVEDTIEILSLIDKDEPAEKVGKFIEEASDHYNERRRRHAKTMLWLYVLEYGKKGLSYAIEIDPESKLIPRENVKYIIGRNLRFDAQLEHYTKGTGIKPVGIKEQDIVATNISNWTERGKKLIYPQREEDWANSVKANGVGLYDGAPVNDALDAMELLDKGASFQEVHDLIDSQDHSGGSYAVTMALIMEFSKRGPEYYRHIDKELTPATQKYLEKIEKENKQFEQELAQSGLGE